MTSYGGGEAQFHSFFTSTLDGQLHAPAALPAVPSKQKVGWASELDLKQTSLPPQRFAQSVVTSCWRPAVRHSAQFVSPSKAECQRLPRIAQFTPSQRSLLVPLIGSGSHWFLFERNPPHARQHTHCRFSTVSHFQNVNTTGSKTGAHGFNTQPTCVLNSCF